MIDTLFKNFVHRQLPHLKVVSGVSYMETLSVKNLFMAMIYCNVGIAVVAMALVGSFGAFVTALVTEREEKTLYLMRVHGASLRFYLATTYAIFMAVFLALYGVVVGLGRVWLELAVFVHTAPSVLLLYGLLWGHAQVGTAFWIQSFTHSTKMASVFSVLFSIASVTVSVFLNTLFATPLKVAWFLYALPHFALVRVLSRLSLETLFDRPVQEVGQLDGEAMEFAVAALVFSSVYLWLGCRNLLGRTDPLAGDWMASEPAVGHAQPATAELEQVESILRQENERSQALLVHKVVKSFRRQNGETFLALQGVSMHIRPGEVFGLLGPNGAGKSTLINILTGLIQADAGRAVVGGREVTTATSGMLLGMGVCPQFDCLWPDLTPHEHFLFYARMRGCRPSKEEEVAEALVRTMRLESHAHRPVSQLSGGMRRRVSIGIATCGASGLVLLDEPTSGLDPVNRTEIWRILKQLSGRATILLTTHLMEEADSLCDRIGIINKGELLCADFPLKLKQALGGGLVLSLVFQKGHQPGTVLAYLRGRDPGLKVVSQTQDSLTLRFSLPKQEMVSFCRHLEDQKTTWGLQGWSLSHAGLHDVFLAAVQPTVPESRASLVLPTSKRPKGPTTSQPSTHR